MIALLFQLVGLTLAELPSRKGDTFSQVTSWITGVSPARITWYDLPNLAKKSFYVNGQSASFRFCFNRDPIPDTKLQLLFVRPQIYIPSVSLHADFVHVPDPYLHPHYNRTCYSVSNFKIPKRWFFTPASSEYRFKIRNKHWWNVTRSIFHTLSFHDSVVSPRFAIQSGGSPYPYTEFQDPHIYMNTADYWYSFLNRKCIASQSKSSWQKYNFIRIVKEWWHQNVTKTANESVIPQIEDAFPIGCQLNK